MLISISLDYKIIEVRNQMVLRGPVRSMTCLNRSSYTLGLPAQNETGLEFPNGLVKSALY